MLQRPQSGTEALRSPGGQLGSGKPEKLGSMSATDGYGRTNSLSRKKRGCTGKGPDFFIFSCFGWVLHLGGVGEDAFTD